jgi:hypothetical protein
METEDECPGRDHQCGTVKQRADNSSARSLCFMHNRDEIMAKPDQQPVEEYIKLALAIEEHRPGYLDSYFGPDAWMQEAKHAGKIPLPELTKRVERLSSDISQADGMEAQRKDFFVRQVTAMQMSLRLLSGEKVSLAEEACALYDVIAEWKQEAIFEEAHRELDQILPTGDSLEERTQKWKSSLEIPIEKVRELLPVIIEKLQGLTQQKFGLPQGESFQVKFVSDQPWMAYNYYLGGYRSRIEINTSLPLTIDSLVETVAHEAYPGHHTELATKDEKLVRQKKYEEHVLTLINSPACVIAEGIATSALEAILPEKELEDWYRSELLPRAGLKGIDPGRITARSKVVQKSAGLEGNAAFMLYDQHKDPNEIRSYLQKHGLYNNQELDHILRFISNPLDRSYIFTYHIGHDLLSGLFSRGDGVVYFKRLLEEPVTPSQIRGWIKDKSS